VAVHAEYAVGCPGIAQILNLPLAVPAAEAGRAKSLVAGQDGEILNLISAGAAAVGAVVADERAIAEQEQVRVRVEQSVAGVAAEAVEMPSISGELEGLPFLENLATALAGEDIVRVHGTIQIVIHGCQGDRGRPWL